MRATTRCVRDATADEALMWSLATIDEKEARLPPFYFLYYRNYFCMLFVGHSCIEHVDGAQRRQALGVSVLSGGASVGGDGCQGAWAERLGLASPDPSLRELS